MRRTGIHCTFQILEHRDCLLMGTASFPEAPVGWFRCGPAGGQGANLAQSKYCEASVGGGAMPPQKRPAAAPPRPAGVKKSRPLVWCPGSTEFGPQDEGQISARNVLETDLCLTCHQPWLVLVSQPWRFSNPRVFGRPTPRNPSSGGYAEAFGGPSGPPIIIRCQGNHLRPTQLWPILQSALPHFV